MSKQFVKNLQAGHTIPPQDEQFVKKLETGYSPKQRRPRRLEEDSESSDDNIFDEVEEEEEKDLTPVSPNKLEREKAEKKRKSLMKQIGRQQKALKVDERKYIDANFILGTSDDVERLFSACKHVLTPQRMSMSPRMFEFIMLLKANRELWGLLEVHKAVRMTTPKYAHTVADEWMDSSQFDLAPK